MPWAICSSLRVTIDCRASAWGLRMSLPHFPASHLTESHAYTPPFGTICPDAVSAPSLLRLYSSTVITPVLLLLHLYFHVIITPAPLLLSLLQHHHYSIITPAVFGSGKLQWYSGITHSWPSLGASTVPAVLRPARSWLPKHRRSPLYLPGTFMLCCGLTPSQAPGQSPWVLVHLA